VNVSKNSFEKTVFLDIFWRDIVLQKNIKSRSRVDFPAIFFNHLVTQTSESLMFLMFFPLINIVDDHTDFFRLLPQRYLKATKFSFYYVKAKNSKAHLKKFGRSYLLSEETSNTYQHFHFPGQMVKIFFGGKSNLV